MQIINNKRPNTTNFDGRLINGKKVNLVFSDLDGTLLDGSQKARNEILNAKKDIVIPTTARSLPRVLEKVDAGVIKIKNFLITDDGSRIYTKTKNKLQEIMPWTQKSIQNFHKPTAKKVMEQIAPKHLTEYDAFNSDFILAYFISPHADREKICKKVQKEFKKNGLITDVSLKTYPAENVTLKGFQQYASKEDAIKYLKCLKGKHNPDGSATVIYISSDNKGKACEYLRKKLGFDKNNTLALGDAFNDVSMLKQGYNFGVIQSKETALLEKEAKKQPDQSRVFYPKAKGADGIREIYKPK